MQRLSLVVCGQSSLRQTFIERIFVPGDVRLHHFPVIHSHLLRYNATETIYVAALGDSSCYVSRII